MSNSKVSKALRVASKRRKYARGGDVDDLDPSNKGQTPKPLQYSIKDIPDTWTRAPQRYADGGETDVDWSKMNQPFGELKGNSPEDTPVAYKTASPLVNIKEGDIDRAIDVGMGAGPGTMVGPYGAHMLRAADRAAVKPHPVYAKEAVESASGLRPEFRDAYKGWQVDARDAAARGQLEMRNHKGSQNPADNDVWNSAGWHRGIEGAAKKEIPDLHVSLKPVEGKNGEFRIDHPAGDFHGIYDVPNIKFDARMSSGNGAFNTYTNQIILGGKPSSNNLKASVGPVLHELEHAIQKKEGFAKGSSLMDVVFNPKSKIENELFPLGPNERYMPSWQADIKHPQREIYSTYRQSAGEGESNNVMDRRVKSFRYLTKPENTERHGRGVQWVNDANVPRDFVKDYSKGDALRDYAKDLVARRKAEEPDFSLIPKRASGGGVGNFNQERASAFGLAKQGMINSDVPGRTDKLNLKVPTGSYVIPADIPSAIGEGNTTAGSSILNRMFKSGPYGMNLPKSKSRLNSSRGSSLMKKGRFAEGGAAPAMDIVAAGGEYLLHPEAITELGGGNLDTGHSILDAFVKHVRSQHIKTLRGLKPPKGSE